MKFIRTFRDRPFTKQRVTLDGKDYVLRLQWNSRSGWYLGLADQDDSPIFQPRKLVVRWDMLQAHRHDERCPPGGLFAVDLDGAGRPEYGDLATSLSPADGRVVLFYAEESEL